MDGTQWIIIIFLVVLVAVFAVVFLRKPRRDDLDDTAGHGSDHPTGATGHSHGASPATSHGASPATSSGHDPAHPGADPAAPGPAAPFDQEATYTDTATGTEVPVEEASPHPGHVDDVVHNRADGTRGHSSDQSYAQGSDDEPLGGASEHTDMGHPGPASQGVGEAVEPEDEVGSESPGPESATGGDHPESARAVGQGSPGAPATSEASGQHETGHDAPVWTDHDDVPSDAAAAGFPTSAETGHGHHPDAPPADEFTQAPPADEFTQAPPADEFTQAPPADEFTQAPPAEGPYGPGSAEADAEGNGPEGWAVKGNTGSMLFHTPGSPSYDSGRAEVWFADEEAARAAGFVHWDRKQR